MIQIDNLTKSFHKHLYENVAETYYCHFSKLSVGDKLLHTQWIQPIWYTVPIFPFCPNIIKMTLKCQSVIENDQLLTNLRQMADYCIRLYSPDPYETNKINIYAWKGVDMVDDTPISIAETFIKDVQELPVHPFDTVAVININVNILLCCF